MASREYPQAPQRPASWQCGAHTVQDPYLYMQDAQDPQVLEWVAAENDYTSRWFCSPALENRISFLKGKGGKAGYSGITAQGGMLYAGRQGADGKYSAVLLNEAFEEVRCLLDADRMDGRMQVFGVTPCPADSSVAAFSALKNGAARMTVVVRDLQNDATLAELDGTFSYTWSLDGSCIYSSTVAQRPDGTTANSVVRWCRATGQQQTVYTWPGHAVFLLLQAAPGGGLFVQVCQNYHDSVIIYLTEAGEPTQVFPENGAETTYIGTIGSKHYFFTDENAPLGKVVAVEHDRLGQGPSEDVVPQGAEPLEGAGVVGDRLLLVHLRDAACAVGLWDACGAFLYELQLPTPMGAVDAGKPMPGCTPGSSVIYLNFQSFTCPSSILRCDVSTGQVKMMYSTGEGPRADLAVERRFVTARDGQQVLAFLVYKQGLAPTGKVPTLMYGYGGYGASQLPW